MAGNNLPKIDGRNDENIIWIHALSVGEVISVCPLIKALRKEYPQSTIVLSTASRSGQKTARSKLATQVDAIFYSPLDNYFIVKRFITKITPSLFILIETDLWPGWLYQMSRKGIPCLLINGRCSQQSFQLYKRFSFLFKPMFSCFSAISMQTEEDKNHLLELGLSKGRITTLGNLKFINEQQKNRKISRQELGLPPSRPIIICGSTHRGEEEIIMSSFKQISKQLPDLLLFIAPRNMERRKEIENLARKHNFSCWSRSQKEKMEDNCNIYILDSMGELSGCYHLAAISFIGGSLVAAGGHNPIEAIVAASPVLFGPHMNDFSEISQELIKAGAGKTVYNQYDFTKEIIRLMENPQEKETMIANGLGVVKQHNLVLQNNLELIDSYLTS